MAGSSEDGIMEEREELLVSATGGIPQIRTAHFLKPIVPSIKASKLKLPYLSPKPRWPLHVGFNGWRDPQKKWEKWADQMLSDHQSLWEKAGIFEAIRCSKYRFHKNNDLLFGIAERWCSETNTFVFPWGEATITLEDVIILGGFSVLGSPVLLPLERKELLEIEMSLKKVLRNFVRMKRHSHLQWLNLFMKSGMKYEREAFLSLWLSRFVFPGNEFDQIGEHLIPIAVHLANGTRIALAPAVLASIYRDLSLLKESMAASRNLEDESGEDSIFVLGLWAPLQLVQLWAWERFLMFRPESNFLGVGDPRAARWHDIKMSDVGNVRPIIDSSGDIFLWRPYTLAVHEWKFPQFYKEIEQWVHIGPCPDEALESFARCLRACVLVGIDCEEPYQPHRVAMQFGLDQDIPGLAPRLIESLEVAWINYSKPLTCGASLYLPARLFESDLSLQYQQWWRKTVLVPVDSFRGVSRGQRSSSKQNRSDFATLRQTGVEGIAGGLSGAPLAKGQASTKQQIKVENYDYDVLSGFLPRRNDTSVVRIETFSEKQIKVEGNDADVPPGFPPKKNPSPTMWQETSIKLHSKTQGNDADVPPGFPPKHNHNPIPRPKTLIKQETSSENFASKHNHMSFVRQETSKQYKNVEAFDLKPPPAFSFELNSLIEQNHTPGGLLRHCKNCRSSKCTAANELNSSPPAQIQGKPSSAAAAIGTSERVQKPKQTVGRTIHTGNAASTEHTQKTKDGNLIYNFITISKNGGDTNCTFNFSSQILVNMQAFMNRVRSEAGNQPHGSRIGDFLRFGGKTM